MVVLTGRGASVVQNFRATHYITPTLPYSQLYIRVSGYLIFALFVVKAVIIIITNQFLLVYLGFAASPLDKLLGH